MSATSVLMYYWYGLPVRRRREREDLEKLKNPIKKEESFSKRVEKGFSKIKLNEG